MRKTTLPLIGFALMAILLGAAEPAVPRQTLDQYAKSIQDALPDGWAVRVEPDYSLLLIERKQKAIVIYNMPSAPAPIAGQPTETGTISILLRVAPPKSQADVAAIEKHNADREKALDMLRAQMTDLQTHGKPSYETESYVARTPDQQARLDAFLAVKHALPNLLVPNLFAKDASFTLETDTWKIPAEDSVKKELAGVRQKVESLYSPKPLN